MKTIQTIALLGLCTCAQPPVATEAAALKWEGEYQMSMGGYSGTFSLAEEGEYTYSSTVCTGFGDNAMGHWEVQGQWIKLSVPCKGIDGKRFERLQAIAAEEDRFLVPEGIMVSFYDAGWPVQEAGFVRGGIARREELARGYPGSVKGD